jgi:hypothetical protein
MVFFLGFAFDADNLEKLFPIALSGQRRLPDLFATVRDDSESAVNAASRRGILLPGTHAQCKGLLEQHSNDYSK